MSVSLCVSWTFVLVQFNNKHGRSFKSSFKKAVADASAIKEQISTAVRTDILLYEVPLLVQTAWEAAATPTTR